MQTVTALTAPRFPHLLTAGVCSLCPSAPRWWVYADPKTRARFCMNCLVAAASDPNADPAIAAIGREILEARQQDAPRPAPPVPPAPKPADIAPSLDIAGGRFCTDCGKFGPAWQNPGTCDTLCLACTKHFIQWQEGELRQGYAALAQMTALPAQEARPYHRLTRSESRYLRAA